VETKSEQQEHWADRYAAEIAAIDRPIIISSGISPSGEIHIGNMREVMTADAIFRALSERGATARLNYIADNFDPLRKVYPFLDAKKYEPYVGCPLSEIPCPCGEHDSYSAHFLNPFLAALKELRIDVEVERADLMYKSGRMNPWIVKALERRDQIAKILNELTGKQIADDWSPFTPLCASCGRMNDCKTVGFDAAAETIQYRCGCGSEDERPMAGGGKLVWRIDWPARWAMLGVSVEPFGKDHSTRGGSYDTGIRIAKEIFDVDPPFPIPYEWIRLKGKGDMSSSRGNVLSISRMLEVVPPEVLRYLIIRERPSKSIGFDPGIPLLQLVDEFDDPTHKRRDSRAVELSSAAGFSPVGVPFKHLVVVAQVVRFDVGAMLDSLHRSGYPELSREALEQRVPYAQRWLDAFAPEDVRFEVQQSLPQVASELDTEQRLFLAALAAELEEGMDGDQVHEVIYRVAGAIEERKPADLFKAIYLTLLAKVRGPRAGWFISVLGPKFCRERFLEAAAQTTEDK
jgi:lysyl-tRNA synthetase class 1